MKKIILSLCSGFVLSLICCNVYSQNQPQGGGEPESLALNVYITSAETGCPTTGTVTGTVSNGGSWWPAIPEDYTGPGYYYLFVPNANAICGVVGASAITDIQAITSGVKWCSGGDYDTFNFPFGNNIDPLNFSMSLHYSPACED